MNLKNNYRKTVEAFLGRKLKENEVVHHCDCNRANNSLNNLILFPSQLEHAKFHNKLKKFPYLTNPMRRQLELLSLKNQKQK